MDLKHLPHACGVYIMRDASHAVLYVGKAIDLARRVASYFKPKVGDPKTTVLAPLVRQVDYIPCGSEREALLLERRLIGEHQPFFNSMWKDDKSYPFVRLTMQEDFPRLTTTRQRKRDGALYFGPYPKAAAVKSLLRYLWRRRLFPLRPCSWDFSLEKPLAEKRVKACLYYHTKECPAPCAGRISRGDYRRIAGDAALFFKGRYGDLAGLWEKQMKAASKTLRYEAAAQLRDNLRAVGHMGESVRYRAVLPEDAERRLDSSRGVTELQAALALKKPPHHIECFDISHFQGRQTVGSMVCFQGGEPHKDHYRRFKVRTVAGIDDFLSMKEVVGRRYARLRRSGEALPDLVLVDGGKGQLAMAQRALDEVGVKVPLASLAKRAEEVFLPGRSEAVVLPFAHPGLRLLQRLRDEAHRFAVAYHRLLRGRETVG